MIHNKGDNESPWNMPLLMLGMLFHFQPASIIFSINISITSVVSKHLIIVEGLAEPVGSVKRGISLHSHKQT